MVWHGYFDTDVRTYSDKGRYDRCRKVCGLVLNPCGFVLTVCNSMHSTSSIQGVPKSWPQFDPDGYQQVESKLRAYGRRVYSEYLY